MGKKVNVIVSNKCNLNCKHCYMKNIINTDRRVNYESIIDLLYMIDHAYGIDEIYFWDGESLLGDTDYILEIMNDFKKAKYKIISNLTFKLDSNMRRIIEKADYMCTSFDIDSVRFNNMKQLNRWYYNCKDIISKRELGVICSVTSYVTKYDPSRFIDLFNKIGFSDYFFITMHNIGNLKNNPYLIPKRNEYIEFMDRLLKIDDKKNKNLESLKNHIGFKCNQSDKDYINIYFDGYSISCASTNIDCKLKINPECLMCDLYKSCGGRSNCVPYCINTKRKFK